MCFFIIIIIIIIIFIVIVIIIIICIIINIIIIDSFYYCFSHVTGVIIEGTCEVYFLMDETVKKDNNMECTCLAMALEIGHDILEKRGVETPHHVVFKYDNTAREGKSDYGKV